MEILDAKFIKGVIGNNYNLGDNLPQVAFFGRSNVGKSSVINSLVKRKKLSKVSKNPGKTIQANFFCINNSFYLVDFPGYGYAKHSIKYRNRMIKRIFWYLKNSNVKPRAVFLIIDIKVGLTVLDYEMIDVLRENKHKIIIVANKIDKMAKTVVQENLLAVKKQAGGIPVLKYSAKTNEGRVELIDKINGLIS